MSRVVIEESYDSLTAIVNGEQVAHWNHNDESFALFFAVLMESIKDGVTDFKYEEVY